MTIHSSAYKKIQRLALTTSPLVAAFSFLPIVFITLGFLPLPPAVVENIDLNRLTTGFITVSLTVYLFWQINIALLRYRVPLRIERPIYRYLASFFAVLTGIVILQYFAAPYRRLELPNAWIMPFLVSFANNGLILLLINQILVQEEKAQLKLEKAQLEISNLIAQHEQLKQQIQPHFLFNALSNLQSLITRAPEKAADYTASLAGFLRKSLSLSHSDLVPIEVELGYLQDYIQLQQTRFPGAIEFTSGLPERVRKGGHVPVFTFQILAENAIKHNAFSTDQPLQIRLEIASDGYLCLHNNVQEKYSPETQSGIGLRNLAERYALLKLPSLEIQHNSHSFSVIIPYTQSHEGDHH